MTNATLRKGQEVSGLLEKHEELRRELLIQVANAGKGVVPNMTRVLELCFWLNVVKPQDMLPSLEKYQILADEAKDGLLEEFKGL